MSDRQIDWDPIRVLAKRVLEQGEPLELTDETRALLLRGAREVAISDEDAENALRSLSTATTLLQEVRRRIHDGSWRLSRARDRAYDLRDAGDLDGARQLMRDVLAVEVVPFYREQAEIALEKLTGLAEVRATGQLDPNLNDRPQLTALSQRVQQGHALELTDDVRALLRRMALTAAVSDAETEEALKSPEGAEALMGMILSRLRDGQKRITRALFRMTNLRDSGDIEGARQQMRDVLAVEIVPQYRRMAEEVLRGLDSPPPGA
ncbi:DUSAM domain-containing protein [Archangium lansingense]|uniref:DUSAM domain-containing protein n=1 Tax=Archangium lansingense TaxID=2995310 RepID=A0ABT4AB05_9BACT|nr:DUSAM domain-containing protein [Archangium lansinium]MCY1078857.1 DUSAM domain-containing protein [Archangium lansinium]